MGGVDVRILIPYTARHLDTLAGAPAQAEWVYVGDDNEAYWRTLCDFWNSGDDLLILEHDVVCRPDVLAQFEECPEVWSAFGYSDMCHPECMEAWGNAFGCTRFRKELMADVPDAVTSIPEGYGRDWHNLCDYVSGVTWLGRPARPGSSRDAGYTHHWHGPAVTHHKMVLSHLASLVGD